MAWTQKAGRGIDASENKKPRQSSGRVARVCVRRLLDFIETDATHPHTAIDGQMRQVHAHSLFMFLADAVFNRVGLGREVASENAEGIDASHGAEFSDAGEGIGERVLYGSRNGGGGFGLAGGMVAHGKSVCGHVRD